MATTQTTGRAEPVGLARAVSRAKLLGPVPGPLGAALAYILNSCPDLDYPKVHAAFTRVAAASRPGGPTAADLTHPSPNATCQQLCLDGIPGPDLAPRPAPAARP